MPDALQSLDLLGLKCPLPALRTLKALAEVAPGARLIVACTDPLAVIDIPHLCHEAGHLLERQESAGGVFTFHIRRAAP